MQAGTMQASIQNIVVDLEFAPTPKDVKRRGLGKEIIEVGAVKLDAAGNVAGTFCRYVKPAYIEHIAPKIVRLTGIHDADLRDAESIEAVIEQFAEWAGPQRTRLAAWSGSDKDQVQKECAFKNIELPNQMRHWIDLQRIYPRLMGVGDGRRSMALRTAADWTGAGLDVSSAHRALYDAQGVGMEAIGVPSDYGEYANQSWYDIREVFARTKDFFQVLFSVPSTFIGDPISLDQSGDVTD